MSLYASVENATSDITYLWEMDSTGSGRSFAEISGATGSSYTYRPTGAGTVMIRVTVKNGEGTMLDGGQKVWTITATESTTTMSLSRSSPASESVSMKVGDKQTFAVTGTGLDGATIKWLVNDSQKSAGSLSYEFEPTAAGTYTIVCMAVGRSESKSVSWTVTVTAVTTGPSVKGYYPNGSYGGLAGGTFTTGVTIEGDASQVTFTWERYDNGSGSYYTISGATASEYSFVPDQVGTIYLRVTTTYGGNLIEQHVWTINVLGPTIMSYAPESPVIMTNGQVNTFSVELSETGYENLTYNWYTRDGDGSGWLSFVSAAGASRDIALDEYNRRQVKCEVKIGNTLCATQEWRIIDPLPPSIERDEPTSENVVMTVGDTQVFTVKGENLEGVTYYWYTNSVENSFVSNDKSFTFTPRFAGSYIIICDAYNPVINESSDVRWYVTVTSGGSSGGGDTPSLTRASPTDESVSIKCLEPQTFTVEAKGLDDANFLWYAGGFNVGSGLSISYRVDDPGTTTLTCRAVSKTGNTILASVSWTVTAYEEGGSGGGGSAALFEKYTPAAQNQSMAAGDKMTFSVKANGDASGYDYGWSFSAEDSSGATLTANPANPLECEFAPTKAGTFYVIFGYFPKGGGDITQVPWMVTVTGSGSGSGGGEGGSGTGGGEGGSGTGGEGGSGTGGEGGDEPSEKNYIPIPTPPDTPYVGKMFFHRASLSVGEFSKQITSENGGTSIYATFEARSALPADVTLSDTGVLAGTMSDDLDGEQIVMDLISANNITNCVTLQLVKRNLPDTAPYLGLADPSDDAVDAYIGIQKTFTVLAYDEEEASLTYNWYLDGTPVIGAQNGDYIHYYNLTDSDESHIGATRTISCCATDGTTGETLLKTWTVTMREPVFAFTTESLPNGSVGGTLGMSGLAYLLPSGTSVVALDLVDGELPPGLTPLSNGVLTGQFRKGGSYTFTLRATCSNGETDEREFAINVSGTDIITYATWTVGSGKDGGSGSGSGGKTDGGKGDSSAEVLPTIKAAFARGATAGDTIIVNAITFAQDDLGAYKYLNGITVLLKNDITVPVGDKAPDMTAFTSNGGAYSFILSPVSSGHYGDKVAIAKVGKSKSVSDYTVYGAVEPYYIGDLAIDDDGWLYTRLGCVKITENDDWLNLPDDINRRDVTFSGATFSRNVSVKSEGVLPGTITFCGVNNIGAGRTFDLTFLDDVKTVVRSDAILTFGNGASLSDSKFGGLELEAGATLQFDPNNANNMLVGYRMMLPKTGKVNLSLTEALESGKTCTVSSRYVGDNDPMNVFTVVPKEGDESQYRLYLEGENSLKLAAVSADDAGELDWSEDADALPEVSQGGEFSYTFKAHGPITNGRTGYVDAYSGFTYSFADGAYTKSRDNKSTFNASAGECELLQGAYRYGATANSTATEIGFPFPCGSSFVSTVTVHSGGRVTVGDATVALFDKGLLPEIQRTFAHIYVARSEGSFTVRYGRFGSVALTPDGKMRVSFGPDADTRSVVDPQVALCYVEMGGKRVDFSSAEPYASANDIILTPSCPPGLTLSSSGTLSGRPLVAGDYSLAIKVAAQDTSANTYTMTRTFSLGVAEASLAAPAVTVTKSPDLGDDGYVHVDLGDEAEFEASVGEGQQLRWTLDGAVVSSSASYKLTAPTTRSLDANGARIHRLVAEADDATGRFGWSVRKVWYVVYNRKVYIDAASTASSGGGSTSGGSAAGGADGGGRGVGEETSAGGGADGGVTTGEGGAGGTGSGTTADGLTEETAFADFQDGMFKYLLNGDEVFVKPGTYSMPIDFYNNDAKVTITAEDGAVLDVKGGGRCFRQGRYEVDYGRSGSLEVIFKPVNEAEVTGLALCGGSIDEDSHAGTTFPDSSVNCYGVVGGGAFGGSFTNCVITGCEAKDYGGGAYGAVLNHCIVEDCSAAVGGGCANCELSYCTVVNNSATKSAGGVDGQCAASSSIIIGNTAAGKVNEYASTTTPTHLVPYVPTIVNCFTEGDPLFCAEYHLAAGSPAAGKGAFPKPDATACIVFTEIEGGGQVEPSSILGVAVAYGQGQEFTLSRREIAAVYVNGVKAADPVDNKWTLPNVTANTTVRFVFAPGTLEVGPTREYTTIGAAIDAAYNGDVIKVDAGTYEETLDLFCKNNLTFEAADPEAKPVVDVKGTGRCVTASLEVKSVVFRNFVFVNGCAAKVAAGGPPYAEWLTDGLHDYSDAELLAYGFGGGVFGGRYENCVITNCTALGSMGGGAFGAELIGCEIACNLAGTKDSGVNLRDMCGGGAFGGLVKDCRVHGNSLVGYQNQVYCRYRGAGTFGAEVRNSFVWDNFINCGSVASAIPSETHVGTDGVTVHTVEKAPTAAQLENHKTPIAVDGETPTYATREAAEVAAAKQVADIPTPVARAISNYDAYANLFEIKTVDDGNGHFVNKPALKEAVVEEIHDQAMEALTTDDSGEPRESFQVQKMEKTLTNTIPGLYYALEFSSDMGTGTFVGERHLATGSGSLKLSATSQDTPSGFWRMAVYLTPDGE